MVTPLRREDGPIPFVIDHPAGAQVFGEVTSRPPHLLLCREVPRYGVVIALHPDRASVSGTGSPPILTPSMREELLEWILEGFSLLGFLPGEEFSLDALVFPGVPDLLLQVGLFQWRVQVIRDPVFPLLLGDPALGDKLRKSWKDVHFWSIHREGESR